MSASSSGMHLGSRWCFCLQMEEAELRSWIEKLQVRLQVCGLDSPQQLQVLLESLVVKKQSLCEMLQSWNARLQDLFQQEKGRKRLSVPPSPGRHRQTAADDSKVGSIQSPRPFVLLIRTDVDPVAP